VFLDVQICADLRRQGRGILLAGWHLGTCGATPEAGTSVRAYRSAGCFRDVTPERTAGERRAAVNWAQRLKRVFRIIACIEHQAAIDKILAHLDGQSA